MERTGHHSTDGIRKYKRYSAKQEEAISDILSRSKKPRVEEAAQNSSSLVCASSSLAQTEGQDLALSVAFNEQPSSVTHSHK